MKNLCPEHTSGGENIEDPPSFWRTADVGRQRQAKLGDGRLHALERKMGMLSGPIRARMEKFKARLR